MNNPGAVFSGDIISTGDKKGFFIGLHKGHQLFILNVFQGGSLHFFENFIVFAQQFGCQHLGTDIDFIVAAGFDVIGIGMNGQGHIGRQCPWGGGPD